MKERNKTTIKAWAICREPIGGQCTDYKDSGAPFHRADWCPLFVIKSHTVPEDMEQCKTCKGWAVLTDEECIYCRRKAE